jgi:outer membrane lipoprotein-sorting protein
MVKASLAERTETDMNILRRLPLPRLLALCGLVLVIGVSATALASALGGGPTPPAKPLAQAVHDALGSAPVQGVSAEVKLTDRLLEGANLAGGSGQSGETLSNPLISGATGRLWVANDGRMRLELQSEKGDTQVIYDGHTVTIYDASSNTLYRYTPPAQDSTGAQPKPDSTGTTPSVTEIEEAIGKLRKHANVSEATPTDVAGQPAYTVRVSPKEGGSLLGGAELSFDSVHGLPLRAAVYSSTSSSPVIELAATAVSYGPVDSSVLSFTPPASAKVQQIELSKGKEGAPSGHGAHPNVKTFGKGLSSIDVLETSSGKSATSTDKALEGLPKVKINGISASELQTELGTILSFQRGAVRYVLAGAVAPGAIEALARGL